MYKQALLSLVACAFMAFTAPAMAYYNSVLKLTIPDPYIQKGCEGNYDSGDKPADWDTIYGGALAQFYPWSGQGAKGDGYQCMLTPPLTRITASQAFDAYQKQSIDGGNKVIFIDVRTPEEVFWVGQPAQVNYIKLKNGTTIVPDNYRAVLNTTKKKEPVLEYKVNGKKQYTSVYDVEETNLSGMVYNVPVEYTDPLTKKRTLNPDLANKINQLVQATGANRVIFYCRSGQRSTIGCYYKYCPMSLFAPGLISYEVEAVDANGNEINGNGGFESTSGSSRYLGYRGYPGRLTEGVLSTPSVSFKDAGLPIAIGKPAPDTPLDPTSSSGITPKPYKDNH
jgi:rhodanese-related sulfurtransferase